MTWNALQTDIMTCERCPRLRGYCIEVARVKRAAYRDQEYWGRPVPNFGDVNGRLLIVGLAPAAHGANRTGRMFTGDRSGDFLYRAMYGTGFANQPDGRDAEDGLRLHDAMITATVHCAPPDNKPLPDEIANCAEYLDRTFAAMPNVRGVMALGKIGFDAAIAYYKRRGWLGRSHGLKFAHGALHHVENAPFIVCTYHPSQQNTFTGRLTMEMLVGVFEAAKRELG